jgi:hypothetical protein
MGIFDSFKKKQQPGSKVESNKTEFQPKPLERGLDERLQKIADSKNEQQRQHESLIEAGHSQYRALSPKIENVCARFAQIMGLEFEVNHGVRRNGEHEDSYHMNDRGAIVLIEISDAYGGDDGVYINISRLGRCAERHQIPIKSFTEEKLVETLRCAFRL